MAGAYSSVCALVKYRADTTIKSKFLGTVPLHWLFIFEPNTIYDIAVLLTSKDTSVLKQFSTPGSKQPFLSNTVRPTVVQDSQTSKETRATHLQHFWWGLVSAVIENDLDAVKKPITAGADVNQVSKAGLGLQINALMSAIYQRNPSIFQLLLGNSARFDGPDYPGETPLQNAVTSKNEGIVKTLLDQGAHVDAVGGGDETPLCQAVRSGDLAMVKLLLLYNANYRIGFTGDSDIVEAAVFDSNSEIVNLFLQMGANPNTLGKRYSVGNTLQLAAYYGSAKNSSRSFG